MAVTDYLLNTKDDPTMYAIVAYYFVNIFDTDSEFGAANLKFIAEELDLDEHQRKILFREAKEIFRQSLPDSDESDIE